MRKTRKVKQKEESQSMLGKIIDLPIDNFKQEVINQHINIGTLNNLKLNLESSYQELVSRKDEIILKCSGGSIDKEVADRTVKGIYAELFKIEEKASYITDLVKELLVLDTEKDKVDSTKH